MHWRDRIMRRPDIHEAGEAHELTFSCYRRFAFLKAERTCEWLAKSINEARVEYEFRLWAYVFMPEHVHLLIWPTQPDFKLGPVLKAIKQPVGTKAVAYLRQHAPAWLPRITVRQCGIVQRRFWQPGGGFDVNVSEPRAILAMIEYIHNNPLRRRLVALAEEWKWSSAGWHPGKNTLMPDPIDIGGSTVFSHGRE
jgi:putative transposase